MKFIEEKTEVKIIFSRFRMRTHWAQ